MENTIQILNQIQADSLTMYTKLHNYHWNIKGLQFYNIHQKTEEFYNYFGTMYDDVAERLLQLNVKPIVTLKGALERSKIEEETKDDFTIQYAVESIIKDFNYFLGAFKELSSASENDAPTQAYADDQIGHFQKEIWMLRSLIE
tara:strand:+ start:7679 stop:8110 length:432 start_codon:yes stop_codon:yes gene_type:complete